MRFPLVLARNVDARLNPAAPFEPVALAWSLASSNFQRYLAADVTLHAYDWQSGPGYPLFLEPMAEYPRMNVLGSNFPSPYNDDQWVARRIFRNPRGIFSFDGYYRSMTAAYGPFAAPPTSAHPCNIGLTIAVNTPDDTHHTLTVAYYDPLLAALG